ncbi:hypothetical protein R83H12_02246 [Fibrobacteria bacterium R8-3-H12]
MVKWLLIVFFMALSSYADDETLKGFSILPPRVLSIYVQKNSEWEELLIVLDSELPKNFMPELTDSTVALKIKDSPEHSSVFRTANCSFAKGLAWSDGKLTVYLSQGKKPTVMIMKNRVLLMHETNPGKLESWLALPTEVKKSTYFLPSYEALASGPADFASRLSRRQDGSIPLSQAIQVKRSDASYVVAEDIVSLFPGPSEGRPLEALEFGDRLKVLAKQPPFYKVRFHNREGYVYQRDVIQEAELTTSQKDKLRRLRKEAPGGVDSIAAKFGWKDGDKISYSSFGFRDPFVEVKSSSGDGINIDNLTLVGIIYENERPMALLSDNKIMGHSYTLFEGDTVKNGKILKISKNSVMFLLQEYGVSRRYTMSLPDKYGGIQ